MLVVLGFSGPEAGIWEIMASKLSRQAKVSEAYTGINTLISTSLAARTQCPDSSGFRRHSEEKSGHVLNLSFN